MKYVSFNWQWLTRRGVARLADAAVLLMATFRIDSLDPGQFQLANAREAANWGSIYFEIDTPAAAVTLLKDGVYRLNVRQDGTTEVVAWRGEVEVYNQKL